MTAGFNQLPPGPADSFDTADDLLGWMQRHVAQHGDIFKACVYGSNVYVINSPQYAQHVLLDHWQNYLRKGQAVKRIALSLGNGLISSNGAFWVQQRRMIQPAFKREAVLALMEVFARPNIALRDKWTQAARSGESVNVTRDVSATVLEVTLRSIFGLDYDQIAPQFGIVAEQARTLAFAETCNSLIHHIVQIVEQRRARGSDAADILGSMMRARTREGDQPMPDVQLAREAMTLVIAGHETTASVLNWIWYLLSRYPECDAKLALEVDELLEEQQLPDCQQLGRFTYTRQVIEEALRTYPPLWLITRKAHKADSLGQYPVPAGTEIYISPYLLQRHPLLWSDPDGFDPERFATVGSSLRHPLEMCPFGAGPRNCIGEFFARVEMQIHLVLLAKELRLHRQDALPAQITAGVNLLSRDAFIMKPEFRWSSQHRAGADPPSVDADDLAALKVAARPHRPQL